MIHSYFSKKVRISNRLVGHGMPTYIIAEAGVNHNGDVDLACKLVDVAKESGADAVKFQLFNTESLILQDVSKADYQKSEGSDQESQFSMLKELEMSHDELNLLRDYVNRKSLDFIVTPFDEPSLSYLSGIELSALKVSSTDLTNIPFLHKVAELSVPVLLSTGMSELSEVQKAVEVMQEKCENLILLQCTSSYPAPTNSLNLNVIKEYQKMFDVLVGYSDHTVGIGASPYAVAAGAVVVEKHFTLDKEMPGPDHKASLSPVELNAFVKQIRMVEAMMGDGIKSVELCELPNRRSLQKSLIARTAINPGEIFGAHNLVAVRAGGIGVSPIYFSQLAGRSAVRHYRKGELIDA